MLLFLNKQKKKKKRKKRKKEKETKNKHSAKWPQNNHKLKFFFLSFLSVPEKLKLNSLINKCH